MMLDFKCVRFDSSNAFKASWVNVGVCDGFEINTADGNNFRTAEFGLNALWNSVDCFFIASESSSTSKPFCGFS